MRSAVGSRNKRLLESASARLERAGCDTPRLDAELLLAHALGVDRARLYIEDLPVPAACHPRTPSVQARRGTSRRRL